MKTLGLISLLILLSLNLIHPTHANLRLVTIKTTSSCLKPCEAGLVCVKGICKQPCNGGNDSATALDRCPNGYQCMKVEAQNNESDEEIDIRGGGFCEKTNCGGVDDIPCSAGSWCKVNERSDNNVSDGMGVCTDEKCPTGCVTWFDGCNICQCNSDGFDCDKTLCLQQGYPYCIKEVGPSDELHEAMDKVNEFQAGIIEDIIRSYNRLDSEHKKLLWDSLDTRHRLRTPDKQSS